MRYIHDCQQCVSLGEFHEADLYFCRQIGLPTVVARFSDKPDDYTSGIGFKHKAIVEAEKRAKENGLIG